MYLLYPYKTHHFKHHCIHPSNVPQSSTSIEWIKRLVFLGSNVPQIASFTVRHFLDQTVSVSWIKHHTSNRSNDQCFLDQTSNVPQIASFTSYSPLQSDQTVGVSWSIPITQHQSPLPSPSPTLAPSPANAASQRSYATPHALISRRCKLLDAAASTHSHPVVAASSRMAVTPHHMPSPTDITSS